MDTKMDVEVPIFDEIDYSSWKIELKGYFKEKGASFWNTVVVGPIPSKNHSKLAAKNNNTITLKTIFNGLSDFVKETIGPNSSTKELWMKLEKVYQDKEDRCIKENEDKYYPKSFDCNNSFSHK
jgi:hypothetical protein